MTHEFRPDGAVWDVKELTLNLGEESRTNVKGEPNIRFEIFDDDTLAIYQGGRSNEEPIWFYEEISMDAAKRLRDFLFYACNQI